MDRRKILAGLVGAVAIGVSAMAPVAWAEDQPQILKVTSFLPKEDVNMTAFMAFIEDVNAKAKGKVELRWVGGPEAIPGFNQFGALKNGVVDMMFGAESYYGRQVTGAPYIHLTKKTPAEERENGYVALRRELLADQGVFYLGRGEAGPWFHIFTNKPIESLDDFKGQRLRVSGTYSVFVDALGAVPITLAGNEIYTALDRGTVDGYAWSVLGNISNSWNEVVKYIVAPRLFQMNIEVLVNKETWDGLSPELQELIDDAMAENEREFGTVMTKKAEEEYAQLLASGVELLELSPEDTKRYVDLAYDTQWKVVEDANPDLAKKLRALFGS